MARDASQPRNARRDPIARALQDLIVEVSIFNFPVG
jgi:hypothetical protein